ncbi:MAG: cation transporter [Clostridia bacterium]|nr:cation transporter [Clostridia bacterium]
MAQSMIQLLARFTIQNHTDLHDPSVRRGYGTLCGVMGICLNLLQSIAKLVAGWLAGSVAIAADGINNLSDSASSIVTLWGFRNSGKQADGDHPFGHGRSEYVAGIVVAVLVMVIGVEIIKEAIGKLIHPEPVSPSLISFIVLGGSVLLKLYMFAYNRGYGKKLDSPTLKAVAVDSIADVFVTLVVILAMVLSKFTTFKVDAWGGLLVGLFVLYMGYQSLRETVSPLLGAKPDPEFVEQVREIVSRQPHAEGVHDIVVHDYGHGIRYVTLDMEASGALPLSVIHDEADFAEHMLRKELGCKAVIHVDPVMEETEEVKAVRRTLEETFRQEFAEFELQDVRIVPQESKDRVVFEIDFPVDTMGEEEPLRRRVKELAKDALPDYSVRVVVDHEYV